MSGGDSRIPGLGTTVLPVDEQAKVGRLVERGYHHGHRTGFRTHFPLRGTGRRLARPGSGAVTISLWGRYGIEFGQPSRCTGHSGWVQVPREHGRKRGLLDLPGGAATALDKRREGNALGHL